MSTTPTTAFGQYIEEQREALRQASIQFDRLRLGASTSLKVAENAEVAIIGTQLSTGGTGCDEIYVVTPGEAPKRIAHLRSRKGERLLPTAVSADGVMVSFTFLRGP